MSVAIPGSASLQAGESVQFSGPSGAVVVTYSSGFSSEAEGVSYDGRTLTFDLPDLLGISVQAAVGCRFVDSSHFYACPLELGASERAVSFTTVVSRGGDPARQARIAADGPRTTAETTISAGWNLVSSSAWEPLTGPIYMLQADGTSYKQVDPEELQANQGYWLYANVASTSTVGGAVQSPLDRPCPRAPRRCRRDCRRRYA